jgi:hypothetical protein
MDLRLDMKKLIFFYINTIFHYLRLCPGVTSTKCYQDCKIVTEWTYNNKLKIGTAKSKLGISGDCIGNLILFCSLGIVSSFRPFLFQEVSTGEKSFALTKFTRSYI